MAEVISFERFELPDSMAEISEKSFWDYLEWERGSRRIQSRVKEKFEPGLFALTPYSDYNRPAGQTEDRVPLRDKTFIIRTTPTTKTPAYSEVVEGFESYLRFIKDQRQVEEATRKGVRVIGEELYIHLDLLEDKLNRDLGEIRRGREGVSQQTKGIVGPDEIFVEAGKDTPPKVFTVSFDIDYSQVTPENGNIYWSALNFLNAWGKISASFAEQVKSNSLQILGGEPGKPVAVEYPFDHIVFWHQLEPRKRTAYKDVIDAFLKPPTKQIRKGSSIGDFRLVRMVLEGQEPFLREKGIVDDRFFSDYNPTQDNGKIYVRLQGVADRLAEYSKSNPFIEQNFYVRKKNQPIPSGQP